MNWVNKYINIPYQDKGRTMQGADCWGLVYLVLLNEFGVLVPTYTGDYTAATGHYKDEIQQLIKDERQRWHEVPEGQERPGDVVNLRIMSKDWHTGIIVAPRLMLHTLEGHWSVVENPYSRQWYNRIAGFYRHEQLAR